MQITKEHILGWIQQFYVVYDNLDMFISPLYIFGAVDIFIYPFPRYQRKAVALYKTTNNCEVLKQSSNISLQYIILILIQARKNNVPITRLQNK